MNEFNNYYIICHFIGREINYVYVYVYGLETVYIYVLGSIQHNL